jgi:hypothetical protein
MNLTNSDFYIGLKVVDPYEHIGEIWRIEESKVYIYSQGAIYVVKETEYEQVEIIDKQYIRKEKLNRILND